MKWTFLLIGALFLAACSAPAPLPEASEPTLALADCRLRTVDRTTSAEAECASLAVPLDHARPDGPTIELRVAVLASASRAPAADPLFLIAGGPGQASTAAFVPLLPALAPVLQSRDLVLVDQRGTGGSAALDCPLDSLAEAGLDPSASLEVQRQLAEDCLEQLAYDPAYFGTAQAVADLDAVRAALGYSQINLLGVSYGSRVALAYAAAYPDQTRSLVLDGVVPQDLAIGAEFAATGQRALDLVFARCAADPACAAAFPDPAGDLERLLADLAAAPATVTLDDPFSGAPTSTTLTRDIAAITVQSLSYAPETAALLPLLIQTAAAGDLRPLAAQGLLVTGSAAENIALGMRLAIVCAEDVPFFSAGAAAGGYLGDLFTAQFQAACASWPAPSPDPTLREPVAIAAPALLLSGEADPVTPPEYGEREAARLANSAHLVAPGQGHNIFFRGCAPQLIADFLAAGSASGLEPACLEGLAAPPFFTSFTGPGA